MLIDEANTLLRGLRSDEHDDSQVVYIGYGFDIVKVVLERQIGDDDTTDTAIHARLTESLDTILHDRIEVSHKYQWYRYFVFYALELIEQRSKGHSVL